MIKHSITSAISPILSTLKQRINIITKTLTFSIYSCINYINKTLSAQRVCESG